MRRFVILGIVIFLIIIIAGLTETAMDPTIYSGEWYFSGDQSVYLFQEGLISQISKSEESTDADSICGAYFFCRDSIVLFVKGIGDLETVKELYLYQNSDGNFLCENKDGTGIIYFIRYRK